MKPQVLQLNPILIPAINDQLASLYTVHKLFEVSDKEVWLREHGPAIDAAITGGHTGISRAMLEQLGDKYATALILNPLLDTDGLLKPKAFIVLKPGKTAGNGLQDALKEHVKAKAGMWKYPRWIEIVDGLPKTATGKIQRFKLRDSA